jgi:triosephosphate isomerase
VTLIGVGLKMHLDYEETLVWCRRLSRLAISDGGILDGSIEMFVLPSAPAIVPAIEILSGSRVRVGAQDLSQHDGGPFTGEISGTILAQTGCSYVEVGHAERRVMHHEDDSVVAAKVVAALRNSLIPIVCVGEPERMRTEAAAAASVSQLAAALQAASRADLGGPVVVAYEPVWAIGAPEPAPPEHIKQVCTTLAGELAPRGRFGSTHILYGGSAGPGLLTELGGAPIDGLFLGRAACEISTLQRILGEAHDIVGRTG